MGRPVGAKKRAAVLARDGGLCVLQIHPECYRVANVVDHRANRGAGGARSLDGMSNLIAACNLCNGRKETMHGEALRMLIWRGVRVESHSTHAQTAQRARDTPVIYPDGRSWLLGDDGSKTEVT